MFQIGKNYTKNEIYAVLSVPLAKRKGAWDTGYREYEGNVYVFANIGMPGRTGHEYSNYWDGDLLNWEAKTTSNIDQPLIKKILDPGNGNAVFLFTRTDNREAFTYEGVVTPLQFFDTTPVRVIWQLTQNDNGFARPERLPEEVGSNLLPEGGVKKISVNKYERNPLARRLCIQHYGCKCQVCDFDFQKRYGEFGRDFIHVHHVALLSSKSASYLLDPIKDLVPVCPNCHAMIHRKSTPLTIEELRNMILYS